MKAAECEHSLYLQVFGHRQQQEPEQEAVILEVNI